MAVILVSLLGCLQFSFTGASSIDQGMLMHANSLLQAKVGRATGAETSNAVQQYVSFIEDLATKVAIHNGTLAADEKAALDKIRQFVMDMIVRASTSKDEDQGEVNQALAAIVACNDNSISDQQTQTKSKRLIMEEKRRNHSNCRASQNTAHTEWKTHCDAYDSHRKNNFPPACMATDLDEADVKTTDGATRVRMEACLVATHLWLKPLYALYLECKRERGELGGEKATCDGLQGEFEFSYCTYEYTQGEICGFATRCRAQAMTARTNTHAAVVISEAARKADVEAGKTIDCYFDVFEASNAEKQGVLSRCKAMSVDTSAYNIVYHAVPAAATCDAISPIPCDGSWVSREYDSLPANAGAKACVPC